MPNFFLSHKRAKVARCVAPSVAAVFGGRLAPDGGEHAAIRPKDCRIQRRGCRREKERKRSGAWACYRSDWAMKLFTGWVISAGLVVTAAAANAQVLAPYEIGRSPYTVASDVDGPYAGMPPEAPPPRYRYGPALLPATEVYTILRENGFLPLGIPQQRGFVYTISVIDRGGEDGRLVIDARTGRIIRFMPAHRMGDNFNDDLTGSYGPAGPLPPVSPVPVPPRPPASVPRVASRTPLVPMPKAAPPRPGQPPTPPATGPAPAPAQQSAAVQPKPADAAPTTPQAAAPAAVEAKPAAPPIQPTQEMPKVQGLE